jgi:hypothetical protein
MCLILCLGLVGLETKSTDNSKANPETIPHTDQVLNLMPFGNPSKTFIVRVWFWWKAKSGHQDSLGGNCLISIRSSVSIDDPLQPIFYGMNQIGDLFKCHRIPHIVDDSGQITKVTCQSPQCAS